MYAPLGAGVVQHHRGEQEAQEAVHEHQSVRIREVLPVSVLSLKDTLLENETRVKTKKSKQLKKWIQI